MIYLDVAASTKPDKEVIDDISYANEYLWENPSSIYESGRKVRKKVEQERDKVLEFLNGDPADTIIFCSTASEALTLGIQGIGAKSFSSGIEHLAIENQHQHTSYKNLIDKETKMISLDELRKYFDVLKRNELNGADTKFRIFISSLVNSELGIVNHISDISEIVHKYDGLVLCDACQAVGHMNINVKKLGCDMLVFTSEKIGMPRGVSVLYMKENLSELINPIIYGGHQEKGLRPGTENTAMIYALGKQLDRIQQSIPERMSKEMEHEYHLKRVIAEVCHDLDIDFEIFNCGMQASNILSVTFRGFDNQQLLSILDINGVCCSSGSACSSGDRTGSHVLRGIGMGESDIHNTLRFSFDYHLTAKEIDDFGALLKRSLSALKMTV